MTRITALCTILLLAACSSAPAPEEAAAPAGAKWETISTQGKPTARHETSFVEAGGKFYLIGGRGMKPVDVYDPETNTWTAASGPPIEIHHFQPSVYEGRIYIAGALTGKYPHETPVQNVMIYDPAKDEWSQGPEIPEGRRRGAAGSLIHDGTLYIVCGIVDGHWAGYVPWLDALDLESDEWTILPDAPRPRDHFQAAWIDGKIYAAGGRTSSAETGDTFKLSIAEVDIYDVASQTWSTADAPIPTQRAGTSTVVWNGKVVVLGGESGAHETAHSEVEAFDPASGAWASLPQMVQGRHGTGVILYDGKLWEAAGSANRGGGPELDTLEALKLPQ